MSSWRSWRLGCPRVACLASPRPRPPALRLAAPCMRAVPVALQPVVTVDAGMNWGDGRWEQRILDLSELSDKEKQVAIKLIRAMPEQAWEIVVPKDRSVAAASLRKMLAVAAATVPTDATSTLKRPREASPDEGILSRGDDITPRTSMVLELLDKADRLGLQLLLSLPSTGKTSVLQLLHRLVTQGQVSRYSGALFVKLAHAPANASWSKVFKAQTGLSWSDVILGTDPEFGSVSHQRPVLVLIDELQTAYGKDASLYEELWGAVKDLLSGTDMRVRIVAAAMFGHSPSGLVGIRGMDISKCVPRTPFVYRPEHVVKMQATSENNLELRLSKLEFSELWDKFWSKYSRYSWLFKGNHSRDTIYRETQGLVGTIMFIMDDLNSRVKPIVSSAQCEIAAEFFEDKPMGLGDHLLSVMFRRGSIYAGLKGVRSFLGLTFFADLTEPRWMVLQRLADAGLPDAVTGLPVDELAPDEHKAMRTLHLSGCLSLSEDGELYSLPSALHWRYCQHQLQKRRLIEVDATQPASMEAFVPLAVRRMSARRLRETLRTGVAGTPLEDKYQLEFANAALSILPRSLNICPEVPGAPFGLREEGKVDFWVSPLDWAFELLRDGQELKEHEARFEPGGTYHRYPWDTYGWDQYAVLDFRSASAASKLSKRPCGPNTYVISFSDDFGTATVVRPATGMCQTVTLAP